MVPSCGKPSSVSRPKRKGNFNSRSDDAFLWSFLSKSLFWYRCSGPLVDAEIDIDRIGVHDRGQNRVGAAGVDEVALGEHGPANAAANRGRDPRVLDIEVVAGRLLHLALISAPRASASATICSNSCCEIALAFNSSLVRATFLSAASFFASSAFAWARASSSAVLNGRGSISISNWSSFTMSPSLKSIFWMCPRTRATHVHRLRRLEPAVVIVFISQFADLGMGHRHAPRLAGSSAGGRQPEKPATSSTAVQNARSQADAIIRGRIAWGLSQFSFDENGTVPFGSVVLSQLLIILGLLTLETLRALAGRCPEVTDSARRPPCARSRHSEV